MLHRAVNFKLALPLLSVLAFGCLEVPQAIAQNVPKSTNPSLIEKRLAPAPKGKPSIQLNIPSPSETKVPESMRAQLESSKFGLKRVVLEGATVYSSADLASTYQAHLGRTISLLDARGIANKITAFYRNNGYILTQAVVPAQDVTKGTLKIRVVEGFISKVSYQGDIADAEERARLDTYGNNIKKLQPANMADLERYMLLMNDIPGSTITGLIRPSGSQFGGADLVLTVKRRTFEASYTFDNRGTRYLGPFQHTVILGLNSVFNAYDHTQLRTMTVNPFEELFLAELIHDEIIDDEGTKLTVMGSHTKTHPGDTLKYLDIKGDSNLFEIKVSHPFLRSRQQSFAARAAFDVRNTNVDIYSGTAFTRDRLRVVRVGGTYNFLDFLSGSNSYDVQVSQGLNILDATDTGSDRSNPIGNANFTKANFDISRLQPFSDGISLLTSATGQYSFQPLLTDEQFSLGGADYGRAFDPSSGLGDSGLAGKAELRYDELVSEPYLDSYQVFGYFDIGEAWVRGVAAGSKLGTITVASTGVGTRLRLTDNFSGSLEANFPIIKPAGGDPTNYRHNPRIFFSLSARF
ncbi:MAG: ShlB/FhaC/HecB family hemolysin secretion/activation protein [Bdellovibrionales bacterium]|jgi:hemolysin activation/secretion protein